MREEKTVGIYGLGIMGGAIATNLANAGFNVVGFDPDPARLATFDVKGLTVTDDVSSIARHAWLLISSLPNETALKDTIADILASAPGPRTLVETSTLSLEAKLSAAESFQAAGHTFLDCPLSGTGAQARNRDLTVYASGNSTAIEAAAPVFDGFAKTWFDLGEIGNGSRMKYVANLLVAVHNVVAAEALVLAMKAGLDPHRVIEVVRHGAGGSRMFEVRGPMMAEGVYSPVTAGFPMYFKDISIIGAFASSIGVPTPLLAAVLPIYQAAAKEHSDEDVASVCAVYEQMSRYTRGE
ncbi:NAD(P)-dependent oxidoreductase [Ensifer adhaerens]|uniref:NAD(P)-dependent oxidoreductase n=1 Tax=Ensifer adhaerens TaxID=106592 RepID=UPI001CBDCD8F|nr:NAD(P)-dependent oxidoreductase [Ensifer adhaerens]MBZ7927722.1 NAD(P)-dependent oxidoreductase [Ensifer adhaerens]UAX96634.1 NAD(P)-dependent oxidoreductase [Ensifer adhaerens]UAY04022.1 NAD(P)-dependent oxidoreductase [Ensifer adhaerens]UAY12008.1 NAD(P)-dependent oxidoreductase [Ensifer adhaerens]